MALALADSLVEVGWDLNDQAQRYVNWWRTGRYSVNGRCFDIGTTIRAALARFERHGDAQLSGDPSASASGNGSIMRLAPVAIRYAYLFPEQIEELATRAAESSLPTHASPQCLSACRYLAVLLAGLMHGIDQHAVLDPTWGPVNRLHEAFPLHPAIEAIAVGDYHEKTADAIFGSGYVVESLEAALWSFRQARDFASAVLTAVNLGDDADTTGAICGQLAGACWGEQGIPERWRTGLAQRGMIDPILTALVAVAGGQTDGPGRHEG
jgi:ADP-ribosylglycohydrolase